MCLALPWHSCIRSSSATNRHWVRMLIFAYLMWWPRYQIQELTSSACFRNSKWKFLEGVKVSGAPLPRKVIVQQSIRDFGILECLCNYVCTYPCVYTWLSFWFFFLMYYKYWMENYRWQLQRRLSHQGQYLAFVQL